MTNNQEDKKMNVVERSCLAATTHVNEGQDVSSSGGNKAAKNTEISNWDHDLQPSASIQFHEEEISRLKHEFEGKEAAVKLLVFVKMQLDSTEIEVFPSLVFELCREGALMKNLKDLIVFKLCKMSSLHDFLILGGSTILPFVKLENFRMHLDISPCLHVEMDSDVLSFGERFKDGKMGQTGEAIKWVMVLRTREVKKYNYDTIFLLVHSILQRPSLVAMFKVSCPWIQNQASGLHTQQHLQYLNQRNCNFYAHEISSFALQLWKLESERRIHSKNVDSSLILLLVERHSVHFLNKQLGTIAAAQHLLHQFPFDPGDSFFALTPLRTRVLFNRGY